MRSEARAAEALLAVEIAEKLAHRLRNLSPGNLEQLDAYLARNSI